MCENPLCWGGTPPLLFWFVVGGIVECVMKVVGWLYMGICGYEEVLGGYIWVYVVIYGV